ncbi:MAG: hypothetical protein P4K83_07025 [Terracidiphilus sp.]|nr:hypothetical protein [Terracidiphilus sp.]
MPKLPLRAALCFFIAVWTISSLPGQQLPLPELRDGASFKVSGTLQLKHSGYSSYLLIETGHSYQAVFDKDDRRKVHEIGIYMSGQHDMLRHHLGEHITAEGKLMLEPVSPYYYNGVAVQAETVRLTDGKILSAQKDARKAPVLPTEISRYYAQVTFLPRSASYTYTAWNANWTPLVSANGLLSCSLNGSGELLNCFCDANGFEAAKGGTIKSGRFIVDNDAILSTGQENPPPNFAQFSLPETALPKIQRAVLCTRIPAKK